MVDRIGWDGGWIGWGKVKIVGVCGMMERRWNDGKTVE